MSRSAGELVYAWRRLIPESVWAFPMEDPVSIKARKERRWTCPDEKAGFFIEHLGSLKLAIDLLEGVIAGRPGTHRLEWDEEVLALLKAARSQG